MVSLQECLDLAGVDEEAVEIIAAHEGIPEIVAAELAHNLGRSADGKKAMQSMIAESRRRAATSGNLEKSLLLGRVLARLSPQGKPL
ncbi:MAG TPA: hypothetical protein VF104_01100 [Burkholderiales bacterium]